MVVASSILAQATTGFINHADTTRSRALVFASEPTNSSPDDLAEDSSSDDLAEDCRLPTQKGKQLSESIPFINCPQVLIESDLAGNVGFDPLGLSSSNEQLLEYREAEIKHARLAMLAAVGWPVSELEDRGIANFFGAPAVLDDVNRVPSILNGGLEKVDPRFWGFCLGMSAAIDMYGISKSRRSAPDYFPGNLGWDPLNLYPSDKEGQEKMKMAEIKHGRIAMLGVVSYVFEEYVTKMPVVDDTPFFFQPIF